MEMLSHFPIGGFSSWLFRKLDKHLGEEGEVRFSGATPRFLDIYPLPLNSFISTLKLQDGMALNGGS